MLCSRLYVTAETALLYPLVPLHIIFRRKCCSPTCYWWYLIHCIKWFPEITELILKNLYMWSVYYVKIHVCVFVYNMVKIYWHYRLHWHKILCCRKQALRLSGAINRLHLFFCAWDILCELICNCNKYRLCMATVCIAKEYSDHCGVR